MKQNNKKFNNAMHTFVGVLDKYIISIAEFVFQAAWESYSFQF